jgi:hypothetical protein
MFKSSKVQEFKGAALRRKPHLRPFLPLDENRTCGRSYLEPLNLKP